MNVLLTALGSYGDVFPMIGLGAALRGRGHAVTVISNPQFAERIGAAGLGFTPLATAEEYDRLTRDPDLWNPRRGFDVVFQQGAIAKLADLYALVTEAVDDGVDVIGAHGLDLASRVVAETHGARVASVVYAPIALWSDRHPPRMPIGVAPPWAPRWLHRTQFALAERLLLSRTVAPPLDAFREALGLPSITRSGGFWSWYYGAAPPLALFPDWFVSPDGEVPDDWPAGSTTSAFALGDGVEDVALDPAVVDWLDAGEAPIAFTPGSAMRRGEAFFAAAIEACRRIGRRGVLLTKYRDQLPTDLPETILAPGFVPLKELLPRCAAFVHHGGVGSCARGLAAGSPQLIQPMAFDQHDNAWRLRRLGVADEASPRRFTGRRLATKLGPLLESSEVAASTKRWAERIGGDSLTPACERLEEIARR